MFGNKPCLKMEPLFGDEAKKWIANYWCLPLNIGLQRNGNSFKVMASEIVSGAVLTISIHSCPPWSKAWMTSSVGRERNGIKANRANTAIPRLIVRNVVPKRKCLISSGNSIQEYNLNDDTIIWEPHGWRPEEQAIHSSYQSGTRHFSKL